MTTNQNVRDKAVSLGAVRMTHRPVSSIEGASEDSRFKINFVDPTGTVVMEVYGKRDHVIECIADASSMWCFEGAKDSLWLSRHEHPDYESVMTESTTL